MMPFVKAPVKRLQVDRKDIYVFDCAHSSNIDLKTVASFGTEWLKFSCFSREEMDKIGADYFDILPPDLISKATVALDVGCGSGRWAAYLSEKVGFVDCIDPSESVHAAARLLAKNDNVRVIQADVDHIPFEDAVYDLVYSLGVLHHIPDTKAAMLQCVKKVKPGGYFLVYLYYNLENRGILFRTTFYLSNILRQLIFRLPSNVKKVVCDVIATIVYFPLARTAALFKHLGLRRFGKMIPLSYYSNKSFWIMQNDALDRFGTPLEQRFTRCEIGAMMKDCGLSHIRFSDKEPYWHAIGQKL